MYVQSKIIITLFLHVFCKEHDYILLDNFAERLPFANYAENVAENVALYLQL